MARQASRRARAQLCFTVIWTFLREFSPPDPTPLPSDSGARVLLEKYLVKCQRTLRIDAASLYGPTEICAHAFTEMLASFCFVPRIRRSSPNRRCADPKSRIIGVGIARFRMFEIGVRWALVVLGHDEEMLTGLF